MLNFRGPRSPSPKRNALAVVPKRNPPAGKADSVSVVELRLYTLNDGKLYDKIAQPIIKSLAAKLKKGTFNRTRAVDAFVPLADAGARAYNRDFGNGQGFGPFNPATRRAAADEMLDHYMDEIQETAGVTRSNGLALRSNGLAIQANKGRRVKRNPTEADLLAVYNQGKAAGIVKDGVQAAYEAAFGNSAPALTFGAPKVGEAARPRLKTPIDALPPGPEGQRRHRSPGKRAALEAKAPSIKNTAKNVQFDVLQGKTVIGRGYFKPKTRSVWVSWKKAR